MSYPSLELIIISLSCSSYSNEKDQSDFWGDFTVNNYISFLSLSFLLLIHGVGNVYPFLVLKAIELLKFVELNLRVNRTKTEYPIVVN